MTMTSDPTTGSARSHPATRVGIPLALASAASFGLSGPLGRALLESGWTPAAAVAARVGAAFALLAVPTLILLIRTRLPTLRQTRRLVVYGVVAIALAQLCYFSAVSYLSVGVALLIEYSAPVLLIFWHWWRRKQRPGRAVLIGAGIAMIGMVFVLDLFAGFRLHPYGVLWAIGAALCLAGYFILAEDQNPEVASSPLLTTTAGLGVGALLLTAAGLAGLLPFTATTAPATLAGHVVPWWVPLLLIAVVASAFAYLSGIQAVRLLGSSIGSFVALTEVLFAVVFAAILVGQRPTPGQILGGVLVLAGIAIIQRRGRG